MEGETNVVERIIRRRAAVAQPKEGMLSDAPTALIPVVVLLVAITGWTYWSTMVGLFKEWRGDDDYSAGQLVPLVAMFFVWVDRKRLKDCSLRPCWWAGIGLLVLAMAARMYGLLFLFESAERYSLVLTIAALVVLVAGTEVFWRAKWIVLFLFLMVPLPGRIHNLISGPLQRLATTGSVFLLEVFVPTVSQQGNVVMLDENTPMAVAEACSGLRMLTAFIVVAAFIAYMVKRPRWEKVVLVCSSIPIAVVCNMIRIFATGLLMVGVSVEFGAKFFHDFAGLVMMPAAVLLIFGELTLMARLIVPDDPRQGAPTQTIVRKRRPGQVISHNFSK